MVACGTMCEDNKFSNHKKVFLAFTATQSSKNLIKLFTALRPYRALCGIKEMMN